MKKISKTKWVRGSVLYSPRENVVYEVLDFVPLENYARGIALVRGSGKSSLLSVWPVGAPGVDVWQKLGEL